MSKIICPKCGAENDGTAKFCIYCRASLEGAAAAGQAATEPAVATAAAQPTQPFQPPQEPQPTQQFQPPQEPQPTQAFQPPQQPQPVQQSPYGQAGQTQPGTGAPFSPQQQDFPAPPPEKKKRNVLRIVLIIVAILVVGCIGTVVAVFGAASCSLNALADADSYEIGNDRVPSVKTALGERYDVTGSAVKTENGQETLDIVFKTGGTSGKDMERYASYLSDNGWLRTQDADFSQASNPKSALRGFQLAKNSTTSGYVVVVTLYWEPGEFNLVIDRLVGDVAGETDDDPKPAPTPDPTPTPTPGSQTDVDEADLWAPAYFVTLNSRHYGMGMTMHSENSSSDGSVNLDMDVEVYVDGDRSAMLMEIMGMNIRYVIDGGKQYMIDDSSKQIFVSAADDNSPVPDTSGLTFVSVGEDVFQGRTLYCETWKSATGRQTKWFFDTDNEWIEGFSGTTDDGTLNEVYIAWLVVDYDESVFDIPSDYTVVQG
jgi:hypothetical protein